MHLLNIHIKNISFGFLVNNVDMCFICIIIIYWNDGRPQQWIFNLCVSELRYEHWDIMKSDISACARACESQSPI